MRLVSFISDLQSKVNKRVWVLYAEGQRSLPHPQLPKKTRIHASSSRMTLRKSAPGSTGIGSREGFFAPYLPAMLHK
jgi:hypothetical protein